MKQRRFVSGLRLFTAVLAAAAASACVGSFGDKEDNAFALGGTVTGLDGTLVLQNGGDAVTVTADGSFTFGNNVKRGDAYSVTVRTQPTGQTCTVANGSGTMDAPVTNVAVSCTSLPTFSIGGTVTGLSGTLVLRNGTEQLAVASNGAFAFVNRLTTGQTYNVAVDTQPANQTCTVNNGSGTVGSTNVTSISVSCSVLYSIGGTVTGLNGTVVLRNGSETLSVSSNGPFAFVNKAPSGQSYSVTVATNPTGQVCTVANGAGTVGNANVTNISVSCFVLYSIGGTVTGLNGTVVLRNGAETLAVSANGPFTFVNKVPSGQSYSVSVATHPAGQTCGVTNGSGTVGNGDVTSVSVTCVTNTVFYTIGGTVTGLTGTVVLRNNSETLSISANGPFAFANGVLVGQPYSVSVQTQPAGQTCTVNNGSGTVGSSNVTNVVVSCTTNIVTYTIGGSVTGLSGGGTLQLRLTHAGSSSTIDVTSNGSYDFDPDKVESGDAYSVTVSIQPTGQECTVSNGTGTATGNVSNVDVECVVSTLTVGGTISGLSGAGLRIENGASNSVSPSAGATSFTLPDEFNDKTDYDVGIAAQPAGQTCVITRSQGQLDGKDVTDIEVSCVANSTSSLVGTYKMQSDSVVYLTLFADGVYIYGSVENDDHCGNNKGNGVEYGVYTYDQASGDFAIRSAVVDTNGDCGVWHNGSQFDGTLAVTGSGQSKVLTFSTTTQGQLVFQPVDSTAGTIYGSFADHYHRNFSVFIENGGPDDLFFFNTETQAGTGAASGHDAGVEYACGKINGTSIAGPLQPDFNGSCKPPAPHHDDAVDTNGTSGLSSLSDWDFSVVINTLSSSTFDGTRIEPN
jgi:hypothetical protein